MIGDTDVDEIHIVDELFDVREAMIVDEIDEKQLKHIERQLIDSTDETDEKVQYVETHQLDDDDEVDDDEDIETDELDENDDVIHINLDRIFDEIDEIQAIGERDELDEDDEVDIRELDENDEIDETDSSFDELDEQSIEIEIELEDDDFEFWNDELDDVDDVDDEIDEIDEMLSVICSDCSYLQESLTIQIEWYVQDDEIDENDEIDVDSDVIVHIQRTDDLDETVQIDDVQWLCIEQNFINEWLTIQSDWNDCDDVRMIDTAIEEIVVSQIEMIETIEAVWYVKSLIIKNKKQWRKLDV